MFMQYKCTECRGKSAAGVRAKYMKIHFKAYDCQIQWFSERHDIANRCSLDEDLSVPTEEILENSCLEWGQGALLMWGLGMLLHFLLVVWILYMCCHTALHSLCIIIVFYGRKQFLVWRIYICVCVCVCVGGGDFKYSFASNEQYRTVFFWFITQGVVVIPY